MTCTRQTGFLCLTGQERIVSKNVTDLQLSKFSIFVQDFSKKSLPGFKNGTKDHQKIC